MAIKIDLNDWHPDILKFIHCKDDTSKLQFMNISVSLSDKFMTAVLEDKDWQLLFPDYEKAKDIYDKEWDGNIDKWIEKGYPVKIYNTLKAKDLYRIIMKAAWKTGEPGVSFRDTMDRYNPNPHLGTVDRSNPCSEFVSIPYNSCNLGSINLTTVVKNGQLDVDKLSYLIKNSFRFLDNMITVNRLPLKKIEDITKGVRSIGLGVMGLADMMYLLGIKYNSKEGFLFIDNLFKFIYNKALETSMELAEEKGVYPLYKGSKWEQEGIKVRNSNFLSIAPTGSISFIAGVSGGIEPNFALAYSRRTNEGNIYYIVNPIFEQALGGCSEELLEKIINNNGSCQGIEKIPYEIREVFVTSMDISAEDHTIALSKVQNNVDLSVSKTVNILNNATVQDIMDVYIQAWKLGAKGITVYRDGSRENQTLATTRENSNKAELLRGDWASIADDTQYYKRKIYIGCGKITLFIGWSPSQHKIQEFWVKRSGTGGYGLAALV